MERKHAERGLDGQLMRAPVGASLVNIRSNICSPADLNLIRDGDVLLNGRVAPHRDVVPHRHRSGQGRHPGDHDMLPDFHVMPDLAEVINLRAGADGCESYRRTIYASICADFYTIPNQNTANLGHRLVRSLGKGVSESRGPDGCSSMDNAVCPDRNVLEQPNSRMNHRALAHGATRTDINKGTNNGRRRDAGCRINDR